MVRPRFSDSRIRRVFHRLAESRAKSVLFARRRVALSAYAAILPRFVRDQEPPPSRLVPRSRQRVCACVYDGGRGLDTGRPRRFDREELSRRAHVCAGQAAPSAR
jgi:hypothetical protein